MTSIPINSSSVYLFFRCRLINPVVVAPTIAAVGLSFYSYGFPQVGTCLEIGAVQILLVIIFSLVSSESLHITFDDTDNFPVFLRISFPISCSTFGRYLFSVIVSFLYMR